MTAVEWLWNELSKNNISTDSVVKRINKESSIWKQAKKMEKQRIIDAYDYMRCIGNFESGEQYYNETFNK
ncbi:hypothetical protein UFOVP530_9 [uncultured Caudovirales phage]|uniref:Uncharacterized protein n=1 Tax=uncultured Caudovirales phage TaxID=2100421 RepID=A0A6J5R9M1_9CAUD|nr:hypothetical protein UFOVP530_9 [uncultured Caudovirales phage]CAB4178812.1 hypothetical protein UFOVP1027_9 [uncultured Caudovirales phage]CAB4188384.1 hypothetical protein UFOVP1182_27 [uncultured Caudovirales phage]CAB4220618.1 hypothetical protein UFOVP1632_43 [uncultured Caudovirales phage]